jgi:hypothetical protein
MARREEREHKRDKKKGGHNTTQANAIGQIQEKNKRLIGVLRNLISRRARRQRNRKRSC